MISLSKDICHRFKEARKAKGLNQSSLAQMAGCKQSAVSMFESGMVTKISDETVKKMAEILGVSLDEGDKADVEGHLPAGDCRLPVHGYCPNCECPSNIPYLVGGRLFYKADRMAASPAGGKRCVQCGEVLELRCPSCGAALNDGACCGTCGAVYVTPTVPDGVDLEAFVRSRRAEISGFRAL